MSQNFLPCERDQQMLLPTDVRDWLGEEHLARFVIDAVAEMDLEPSFADYRDDGWDRAAHDPQMMVALLLYACAVFDFLSSSASSLRCLPTTRYARGLAFSP